MFDEGHHIPPKVVEQVQSILANGKDACVNWLTMVSLLTPFARAIDFRLAWKKCFANWESPKKGPPPIWMPGPDELSNSNLARWISELRLRDYATFHRWSVEHREEFWRGAIMRLAINFQVPPTKILEVTEGIETPNWLPNAKMNIVESCFQNSPDAKAVIFGGPDGRLTTWTQGELKKRTLEVASAIRAFGFKPGDPLAVVLPMTADSVAIYLGAIWAGCVVVSIADSFAPREIASRLRIADAKAVFTYDEMRRGGKSLSLYSKVAEATELPIIALPLGSKLSCPLRKQDQDWQSFLVRGHSHEKMKPHIGNPLDTINILFSSGTTGDPKAIPWNHTTPIKCAIDGYCHQDIRPGQVACWPTNLGWMMGPFLIFAALINRGTIALYEDVPVGPGFGRFVQDAKVNMLGVIPTLVKTWRAAGDLDCFDWSSIHVFSSTGESSQPDDMVYLASLAGVRPIIEYCGGTEIGGGYISSTVLEPTVPSAFTTPAVGLDFVILSADGAVADEGEIFLVPPSIGLSVRLLNRDHHETYFLDTPKLAGFPQLRRHGDHFRRLAGGYFVAGGRVDDTMNLGGIKVSSAELERVMNEVAGVRETAAIALATSGGPEELYVFAVCLTPRSSIELLKEFNGRLRSELNPLFKAKEVRIVDSLPRTASNKVMRRKLRDELVEQPADSTKVNR